MASRTEAEVCASRPRRDLEAGEFGFVGVNGVQGGGREREAGECVVEM